MFSCTRAASTMRAAAAPDLVLFTQT
jgi:hypothetical protein